MQAGGRWTTERHEWHRDVSDERDSRTASSGRAEAAGVCRAVDSARGDTSHMGQWASTASRSCLQRAQQWSFVTIDKRSCYLSPSWPRNSACTCGRCRPQLALGRLQANFSVRSVFGRPMRFASRGAGDEFLARHYRCFSGQETCPTPLPIVPADCDRRLRWLRQRLQMSQADLARRIGAAGKAVVYQWECRKRKPSPVFWQRIERL